MLSKKILFVLSSAILAVTARGDMVVFTNFGPGNTYAPFSGFQVGTLSANLLEMAAEFTAGASGNLASVDLGLTYRAFGGGSFIGPVNVYLYGNASGSPDNGNQTFLGSGTPAGVFFGGINNSVVSFAVAGTVPVTTGTTYWLVLKPGSTNMADIWNTSSPVISASVDSSGDDSRWSGAENISPAFRLTVTVPEPTITAFILPGLMAALLVSCRMFPQHRGSR
jgi:hypothetical protein